MKDKYSNTYFNMLIMEILEQNNILIKKFEDNSVYAKYGEIDIEIYHERCMCHGGRLSIQSKHCNFFKRIEHEDYDEERTDSDTELEYEIKNEMIPIIKTLKTFIYKYREERPYYIDNKHNDEIRYYNSIEDLTYKVLEEKAQDVFTLNEPFTHQVPNPNIKYIITPISYENGILKLEKQRWTRESEKAEWTFVKDGYDYSEIYCSIFKKEIK